MMTNGLRLDEQPLDRAGLREAALVARAAFFDDPFYEFLFPVAKFRSHGLSIFFRTVLGHPGPRAKVVTVRNATGHVVGVAMWLPTGAHPQSARTQLSQMPGLLRSMRCSLRSISRGNSIYASTSKVHPKEAHWYLQLVAVMPPLQRQGIGSMLLGQGLGKVDEENVGSYLETQKDENLAYYRRFGYRLRDTLNPVGGGPVLYTMWRAPLSSP
jgi:ribosomal protein S18 acetylase RimI-like enzyme